MCGQQTTLEQKTFAERIADRAAENLNAWVESDIVDMIGYPSDYNLSDEAFVLTPEELKALEETVRGAVRARIERVIHARNQKAIAEERNARIQQEAAEVQELVLTGVATTDVPVEQR